MRDMSIGILTIQIFLPGCLSLKEKRSRLKPLIIRLHKEFNISVAEVDFQDSWQNAMIACAIVSNNSSHNQRSLQQVVSWIERTWPDMEVVSEQIEMV
jgi:uncharacterized protein YlxP (DUF503 family)